MQINNRTAYLNYFVYCGRVLPIFLFHEAYRHFYLKDAKLPSKIIKVVICITPFFDTTQKCLIIITFMLLFSTIDILSKIFNLNVNVVYCSCSVSLLCVSWIRYFLLIARPFTTYWCFPLPPWNESIIPDGRKQNNTLFTHTVTTLVS